MMSTRIRSWPSAGAVGKRKSGPRARSTNSRPSKQLPAIRLVDGVKPAKGQRRQRTATPILATAPRRRSRLWPAPFPPTAPRARQRTPATYDGSAPRDFHATRRPLATRDWWLIRVLCGEAEFEPYQVAGSLPVQWGAGPVCLQAEEVEGGGHAD